MAEAFDYALNQEDAILAAAPYFTKSAIRNPQPRPLHTIATPPPKSGLPAREQKERREKGLCFNCDDVYKPGHVCLKPRLMMLEAATGLTITEFDMDSNCEDATNTSTVASVVYEPAISSHSLMGSPQPKTMRITGFTKGRSVTVLIDTGSTHNFLHPSVAKQCGYAIHSGDAPLSVMVGDGGILANT